MSANGVSANTTVCMIFYGAVLGLSVTVRLYSDCNSDWFKPRVRCYPAMPARTVLLWLDRGD